MSTPASRLFGLQVKLAIGLLLMSMLPLIASVIVIDKIADVSRNYASNEAEQVRAPVVRAVPTYKALVDTKRELFLQITRRWAAETDLAALLGAPAGAADERRRVMDAVLDTTPELYRAVLYDGAGDVIAEGAKRAPAGVSARWRARNVTAPVGAGGARLQLTFAADEAPLAELEALGQQIQDFEHYDHMRSSLPTGYRWSFLLSVGGVVVLVTLTGILLVGWSLTRRIDALVAGTRQVAAGNLASRVRPLGRDELGELGRAFNAMVEELERNQQEISYLQRIGAWQDVARKLAHEIKNPLTPIQLAMQQCVSSYPGDDPRFKKLLDDADEIVSEEIAGLRRLVDAFRTFGQLPQVDPAPLDLGQVVDDLRKDPTFADKLEVQPPTDKVMVRADRLLLRRLIANLVDNGIHAGKGVSRPGRVVVTWAGEPARRRALLTVDDQGPGVVPDDRERIFEPYVTMKEGGTGLGLAIAKKIALEHGGSLAVAPGPSPLGGARFELTLPIEG
ncbi:MAG TPA: ATP-binding protein [Kofleriaceae bacterium]|nr:ATP-binding protein [Kofleriaceae bacterium]